MTRPKALGPGCLKKGAYHWVLDYVDAEGRRKRKRLGGDKRVAERRRMEIIRQRDLDLDGLGSVDGGKLELTEVADLYLADLKLRVTTHHFRNVSSRVKRMLEDLEVETVGELRAAHVVRLRSDAVESGKSHRTANLLGSTLRAMLRWAVDAEMIERDPLEKLKALPETAEHKAYRRRALSDHEIEAFLRASQSDDDNAELLARAKDRGHVPQTPMWRTLLDTGARWNELRLLEWADLDFARGYLVFRAEHTKSRKRKVVPLGEETLGVLRSLQVGRQRMLGRLPRSGERIFLTPTGCGWGRSSNNPMRIFNRVLERAGIAKYGADGRKLDIHALRHTFGTRLSRAGVPLVHAQRLMGHSDPKLTAMVYTHLDVEDLRGAIEGMVVPEGNGAEAREVRQEKAG